MARCSLAGEDFVNFVFSPCVALHITPDVNETCLKSNLRFDELLKPFSQLSKDATTPWFEAWRYVFLKSLRPNTHEFIHHCLASVFVVSTQHPDPITALTELTQTVTQQQQQQIASEAAYPRWFSANVAKFYVLLHDLSRTPNQLSNVEQQFLQLERTFGSSCCYLLTLFTEDDGTLSKPALSNGTLQNGSGTHGASIKEQHAPVATDSTIIQTDPWLNHLLPHGYRAPVTKQLHSSSVAKESHRLIDSLGDAVASVQLCPLSDPGNGVVAAAAGNSHDSRNLAEDSHDLLSDLIPVRVWQPHGHGLSQADRDRLRTFVHDFVVRCLIPWTEQTMRTLNEQIAHRMRLSRSFLSATRKFFASAVGAGGSGAGPTVTAATGGLASSGAHQQSPQSSTIPSGLASAGGQHSNNLIGSSHMVASASESGLPRLTSEDPLNRLAPNASSVSFVPPTTASVVVAYTVDSPELQMRRLADLAFLFQQYEVAHQTYNVLKRDFQNDSAWIHFAGAQEMCALSVYLQGTASQRQYPYHYVDTAVNVYLSCHSAELALRATLLNAEALCSRHLYAEAAMCLLRLTSENDDLTSALLIEQTAHCMLHLRRPLLRKFAFRMALAAHRYNRAKQPHLTLRSYQLIAPILTSRGWDLIEDHINYNLGKQAYAIGDLSTSATALRRNLTRQSQQSVERQSLFVHEYLIVLKKHLSTHGSSLSKSEFNGLPEFPLPRVLLKHIRAMLGKPTRLMSNNFPVEARGIQFTDEIVKTKAEDHIPDSSTLREASAEFPSFSWWMEGTDVSDLSSDDSDQTDDDDLDPLNIGGILETTETRPGSMVPVDFALTNDWIARQLERLLSTVDTLMEKSLIKRPSLARRKVTSSMQLLHTRRSVVCHHAPMAPVGETITYLLPVSNPMHIPLVFTNLHLIWAFSPQSKSHQRDESVHKLSTRFRLTNAVDLDQQGGQRARMAVSTDVVAELILLPEEKKTLEVSLVPRQCGTLHITGLCLDWNCLTTIQQHRQQIQSTANSSNRHTHATFSVGEDDFEDGREDPCDLSDGTPPSASDAMTTNNSQRLGSAPHSNGFTSQRATSASNPGQPERTVVRGVIWLREGAGDKEEEEEGEKENSKGSVEVPSPLQWTIAPPAPLLQVSFSDLPTHLFQGQIYQLRLKLTNQGTEPLHRVRLASNWPGWCTFGSPDTCTSSLVDDVAERDELLPSAVESSSRLDIVQHRDPIRIYPWLNVPGEAVKAGDDNSSSTVTLCGASSTTLPLWLRAPHVTNPHRRLWKLQRPRHRRRRPQRPAAFSTSSSSQLGSTTTTGVNYASIVQTRTVHMVFHYQPVKPNPDYPLLNSRFVRHHHELELRPSVQLEAMATPSHRFGVGCLLIHLRVHNMTTKTTKTTFELIQVSCASRDWVISPVPTDDPSSDTIKLNSAETFTLCLLASPTGHTAAADSPPIDTPNHRQPLTGSPASVSKPDRWTSFSTVLLTPSRSKLICPTEKPWLDFYHRSGTHWNVTTRCGRPTTPRSTTAKPLKSSLGLTLLLIWKVPPGPADGSVDDAIFGQSQVTITRLDSPSSVPSKELQSLSSIQNVPPTHPPVSSTARLVRLRLRHPSHVSHTFPTLTKPWTAADIPIALRSPLALNGLPFKMTKDAQMQPTNESLAVIPVEAELGNTSNTCTVLVELDLTDSTLLTPTSPCPTESAAPDSQSLNPTAMSQLLIPDASTTIPASASSAAALPTVQWIGATRQQFLLKPSQSRLVHLKAIVSRPGLYRLSPLHLRACPKDTRSAPTDGDGGDTWTRQQTPTSVVLVDSCRQSHT